ncbi:MAG: NAD(P)-dependent oxidoreductase [Bacteroidia bacterium]
MSNKHQILIIDEVHPVLLELLSDFDVRYLPKIGLDELEKELEWPGILVLRSKLRFTSEWIDKAPQLKLIGRLGSGMDNIDEKHAASKGIKLINAPEGNRNAVAEQTIGMLLSLLANINRSSMQVGDFIWDRKGNQGLELQNLTVGIIGYGNVGSTLAKKLFGFGCRVLAYDKYKSAFGSDYVTECSLNEIKEKSDVISLHVPLNDSSFEMIDKTFIEEVGKPFFLLNLARGSVVNISDIISGLESKRIRGAALDVLPNEKLDALSTKEREEFVYLSENENVILTPHIGGLTIDSYKKLAEVLGEKIIFWAKNNPLIN